MNVLFFQTLGNHEFDDGVEGLVPYLDAIRSPVVVANIDDSEEPTMHGKYNKSIIVDKYARKIGIIGVILSTTNVSVTSYKFCVHINRNILPIDSLTLLSVCVHNIFLL